MTQCLNPNCLRANPTNASFCQYCRTKLLLVERYRPLRVLGQGGFGRTFLAVDELKPSKPQCVIKQLLPEAQGTSNTEKAAELFAQEAEQLDKLGKHTQIPELLAYFIQDERQYLVQEFIEGQNLAQELIEKGAYNEQQICQLLEDMLNVLQYVHSQNVIHRDIKPENIIHRRSDSKLVLVDFGAAKVEVNPNLSVTGTVIGSAEYTAPEQARGKAKFASDLYSLGVTCIHLLTQTSPFDLFDVGEGDWVWRDYLGDNSVSDELAVVLDKLIATATKWRYQTVQEVLRDFNANTVSSPSKPQQQKQHSPTVTQPQNRQQSIPNISQFPPQPQQGIQLKKLQFETITVTIQKIWLGSHQISYQGKSKEAEYFTVDLGNSVTLDIVLIPGGRFLMGSPASEAGHNNSESPQHWVIVPSFFMGKYPITQAQWQAVMGNNPACFKGDNLPVERVSWHDCVQFCKKLSQITGQLFQLPSEAEWEYACRAGTTTPFHFGETITTNLANYDGNYSYDGGLKGEYRQRTTEVGTFPPNAFGLYDMHGNVWEWCADTWHKNYDDYDGAPIDGSPWLNGGNDNRSPLRGGSWFNVPNYCRCANRTSLIDTRDKIHNYIGFRVVCPVPRSP